MERHEIHYGNTLIDFLLERKYVKNINFNIKPFMTIQVSANEKVRIDFIYGFVKSKGAWIVKNVKTFEEVMPHKRSEREYVSGESFRYLGKQYRLRVEKTTDEEMVKYFRGFIYLYVQNPQSHQRKGKLMDGIGEKHRKDYRNRLDKMSLLMQKYGIEKPSLDLRLMKARWGSALIEKNTILLYIELIKASKHCIDYVVLHELIHFKYNDHSDSFYNMLYTLMPDWEKRKTILDEEIVQEL